MASPISVRIEPETIDLLKKITGKEKTVTAIIDAVKKIIANNNYPSEFSEISALGDKFISTKAAAKMLKTTDRNIRYLAKERKIIAIKLNEPFGRWLISLDDIKIKLIPKIKKMT